MTMAHDPTRSWPIGKGPDDTSIPGAAWLELLDGQAFPVVGAGVMVREGNVWTPASSSNPLHVRAQALEQLIGALTATKETNPDAASASMLSLLRGLIAIVGKEATLGQILAALGAPAQESTLVDVLAALTTLAGTVDSGAQKVTLTGRNDVLLPPVTLPEWSQELTTQAVDVPPSTAEAVMLTLESDTNEAIPLRVRFEHQIREGVYVPWRDGMGDLVETTISTAEATVLGPFRGFPRFLGGRIVLSVPDTPVAEIWRINEFGARTENRTVATDADGNVYVAEYASHRRRVYKIFPDGAIAWQYDCPEDYRPYKIAVSADGSVYVGTASDFAIIKLNASGEEVWIEDLEGLISSITVDDIGGWVYFVQGSAFGRIDFDGTLDATWSFNLGDAVSIAAFRGYVFAVTGDRSVHLLDTSTSDTAIWTHTSNRNLLHVWLDENDTVVVSGYRTSPTQPVIIKLGLDGQELWTEVLSTVNGSVRGHAVGRAGKIYIITSNNELCKYDYSGDQPVEVWRRQVPIESVRAIAAHDTSIYVSGDTDDSIRLIRYDDYLLDVFATTVSVQEVL